MKTDKLRDSFLNFFKERGHKVVRSDSLIPQRDPTLLFTGAGMNQFKDYFLGLKKDIKRAASSQKCLRTADLDEVGKTPYHHSFFEMLGNFSFGDYFKKEALGWAFEFMTKELGIPKERLYVSVHEKDKEAYKIWRDDIKIPDDRIYHLGDKTNFWPANAPAVGPNGPCGPCSEIFYDQGKEFGCGKKTCNVECDCGRFAEAWNLVFTQYDRQEGGKLVPLKEKNIDTGMGLERLACVMQGKKNNFEIDIFEPLIKHLRSSFKKKLKETEDRLLYVMADHARAACFAISDGAIPSNEGRGYVIRKLIRRALWHARKLGHEKPILFTLVPLIEKVMGGAYPELKQASSHIQDVLKAEEERFLDKLEEGLEILKSVIKECENKKRKVIAGEDVFRLYDTYGFPDELTETIAIESQLQIDKKGFEALMEKQRERARKATQISGEIFATEEMDHKLREIPATKFVGYKETEAEATVLSVIDKKWIVLDKTPFYAEAGGQVGDTGIITGKGFKLKVIDVKKRDRHFLHRVEGVTDKIKAKSKVSASVDSERRLSIMRNHTATHLLQSVLRHLLGKSVRQLGSLVAPDRLRFDFSYGKSLTPDQIKEIEEDVNKKIQFNISLSAREKTMDEAHNEGALAFFGEKYGDRVRMVEVEGISKELCGGTHVTETGQIGFFVIVSETSIASGVRRIEAVTGERAIAYVQDVRSSLKEISTLLKVKPEDSVASLKKQIAKLKELERKAGEFQQMAFRSRDRISKIIENISKRGAEALSEISDDIIKKVKGYNVICDLVDNASMNELRFSADAVRNSKIKTILVLFGKVEDKVNIVVACSKDAVQHISANDILKEVAKAVEGSGGGRNDLAQGGTRRVDLVESAIKNISGIIKKHIK